MLSPARCLPERMSLSADQPRTGREVPYEGGHAEACGDRWRGCQQAAQAACRTVSDDGHSHRRDGLANRRTAGPSLECADFEPGTLAVRESVFEGTFQPPKTRRAMRTIPLRRHAVKAFQGASGAARRVRYPPISCLANRTGKYFVNQKVLTRVAATGGRRGRAGQGDMASVPAHSLVVDVEPKGAGEDRTGAARAREHFDDAQHLHAHIRDRDTLVSAAALLQRVPDGGMGRAECLEPPSPPSIELQVSRSTQRNAFRAASRLNRSRSSSVPPLWQTHATTRAPPRSGGHPPGAF